MDSPRPLKTSSQRQSNLTQPLYRQVVTSLLPSVLWGFHWFAKWPAEGWGNFIAQWVPTWLIIGLYNRLVRLEGHDRYHRGRDDDWERIADKEANAGLSAG
jgi:hypothetical protein